MRNQRNRPRMRSNEEEEEEGGGAIVVISASSQHYEQIREQRMKENAERMHKLGLLNLSLKLNKTPRRQIKKIPIPSIQPERRSSRIMTLPPVDYGSKRPRAQHQQHSSSVKKKKELAIYIPEGTNPDSSSSKKKKEVGIYIPEGTNPEVYTEEQEKLLGDCETAWELYVDGYDEDGDLIYDPTKGEKCHQCRNITISQLTSCNKCELPRGQLCGDCLYTRYGENVREADFNPKWTCPCCREICNCNSCRRKNGWMPTGNIYNKVVKLGFKSVAHYLIKTRRSDESIEGSGAENIVVQEIPETTPDTTQKGPIRTRRALRS